MCKVKSGELLKNEQDVQNLVIAIINRQQEIYNKEKIFTIVKYHFRGAKIEMSNEILLNMIDDNLAFLYRKGLINCRNGYYFPQNIFLERIIR